MKVNCEIEKCTHNSNKKCTEEAILINSELKCANYNDNEQNEFIDDLKKGRAKNRKN